jgi:thiamine-phosphate pyrophosphorylase
MAEPPQCRLYLQFPMQPSATLKERLAHAIANTDAACVLLRPDPSLSYENSATLVDLVQASGLACLVADDAELAANLRADGIHIAADPALYSESRKRLGANANIGAACGLSRHQAMVLAEMGADYVAFGVEDRRDADAIDQRAELIAWWSEIFVVPCVAWNVAGVEEAARCAALGADFVAPPLGLWQSDDGLRLIGEIDRAIRQSRRAA